MPKVEPTPTGVAFPDPEAAADEHGVVAAGEDFRPGTLLAAYRAGVFPWPRPRSFRRRPIVLWFSPDPRAVFPLDGPLHWSRSLRRTLRTTPFRVTVDRAFGAVIRACGAARAREGTWIVPPLVEGYEALHRLGHAHSVEVWDDAPARDGAAPELVGGIYGVAVGRTFAGESMFHARTDASKIAFAHLATRLQQAGYATFDVQVMNPHLASLGCVEVPRRAFLSAHRAGQAAEAPAPLLAALTPPQLLG